MMNPTVPQRLIDEALERDPARAASEWLAEFRSDLEAYVQREVIEAAVTPGVYERPPIAGVRYMAFVDPSGGSQDSMTLAIAHRETDTDTLVTNVTKPDKTSDRIVLDLVREHKPPFSPEAVVAEFAEDLARYRIRRIAGDRYAGEWPREAFKRHGIQYQIAELPKSDIYRELLPLLNSGKIELLDHDALAAQLCRLERRVGRSGRDIIDHPPGTHDDLANAVAGALVAAPRRTMETWTEKDLILGPLPRVLSDPMSPWYEGDFVGY
jgi:hypothetical protein